MIEFETTRKVPAARVLLRCANAHNYLGPILGTGNLGDKLCYVNQNQDMIQAFETASLQKDPTHFRLPAKNLLIKPMPMT